jgi:hypothetical protein
MSHCERARMTIQRWDMDTTEGMARSTAGEWVNFSEHQKAIEALSAALADVIAMYAAKQRNLVRLGNARAALTTHGIWPKPTPQSEGDLHG